MWNNIDFIQLIFYSFAAVTLCAALAVVFSRHPVRAVLSLVLTFVGSSGLWMLLQSEFLSLTLVVVYVGAVMVLFLFVVMMLNMNMAPLKEGFVKYLPFAILIAAAFVGELLWVFNKTDMTALGLGALSQLPQNYSNITQLGLSLYTDYIYPFEIAGVILLVAIIAAIGLAFRGPRDRRGQDIHTQVTTHKSDRLKIVQTMGPDSPIQGETHL